MGVRGSLCSVGCVCRPLLKRILHPGQGSVAQTRGHEEAYGSRLSDKPIDSFSGGLRGPSRRIPEAAKSAARQRNFKNGVFGSCEGSAKGIRGRGYRPSTPSLVRAPPGIPARAVA